MATGQRGVVRAPCELRRDPAEDGSARSRRHVSTRTASGARARANQRRRAAEGEATLPQASRTQRPDAAGAAARSAYARKFSKTEFHSAIYPSQERRMYRVDFFFPRIRSMFPSAKHVLSQMIEAMFRPPSLLIPFRRLFLHSFFFWSRAEAQRERERERTIDLST